MPQGYRYGDTSRKCSVDKLNVGDVVVIETELDRVIPEKTEGWTIGFRLLRITRLVSRPSTQ